MTPLPLPNADLNVSAPLSARFAAQGAWTYRDAARLVWDLPVAPTRHAGLEAVLRDRCGTPSTKHGLLAALAEENGLPVDLWIGLFLMSDATTPGVGTVLKRHKMTAVPEARVVLGVGDERMDLTWPGHLRPVPDFLVEEQIQPRQVGSVEAVWHRRQSDAWAEAGGLDADAVWAAREAAIAAITRR